jgi:uncharacterized phage protein gp47/JayE
VIAASYDDFVALGLAELQLRRPDLDVNTGDVTDLLIAIAAAMADKNEATSARLFASTFLDTATGADLTILADDHWGIIRTAAAAAVGQVTFSRATAAAGAGTIPAGTVIATEVNALGQRIQVTTNAGVSFGALDVADKTVAVTCTTTGTDGNVAADTLVSIVSTIFDSTVEVTNAQRLTGGAAEEGDEALRERVRAFPSTLRRGTLAALEYGAKTVAGVAVATAVEGATGLVTLYVADASGNSNTELQSLVAVEIENWRAAGVVVQVTGGVVYEIDVEATLTVRAGYDVAAQVTLIQAAVTNRMAKLRIGETLYLSALKAAIIAVAPDQILDVDFATPLANTAPSANQVIRAGSVTIG